MNFILKLKNMKTFYEEIVIAEEGNPKENGSYITNHGWVDFTNGKWDEGNIDSEKYGFEINLKWWLKPSISTKYNVVKNAYLEEKLKLVLAVYRLDEAWNLEDILKQLVKATDILLKDKGYDGNSYEEMQSCSEYAKQLIIDIPAILGAISDQSYFMNSISNDELRDECERRGFVMNRDTDGFDD